MTELTTGDAAPEFALAASGGGQVALSDFAGRPLVLYFYPKDDTTGCTTEAIAFTQLLPQFEALGASIVGISPDSVKKHDTFIAKRDLRFILGADEDTQVAQRYGVWKQKSMYGRSYMGIERTTFLIDKDGRIARIWLKVKVAGHAEEVLEAVLAL
jgi:peroxiredoxin Q/BCP